MKVVLTGPPGCGKTTVVKRTVKKLGQRAVGFWTEEVRDPKTGKRTGFKVVRTDGKVTLFASKTFTSRKLVGSYGVNVNRFEDSAVEFLKNEIEKGLKGRVIVIDEVGKMELFSRSFKDLVSELIEDPVSDFLVTIPVRDVHPLVSRIRRLGEAVLIEVNGENRDHLPDDIVLLFKN